MTVLTDEQRDRVLHFLGYPAWQTLAASIALGYPAASQPLYLVYDAFLKVSPGGMDSVARDLCECEAIEAQLRDARSRLKASAVGNVTLNAAESRMLRQELQFWVKRLADDLGVVPNPYSQMQWLGMGGGIGARVSG